MPNGRAVLQATINNEELYQILTENRQPDPEACEESPCAEPPSSPIAGDGNAAVALHNGFDRGGPKSRLLFFYAKFVRAYVLYSAAHPDYLAYIWKFARALKQERSREGFVRVRCESINCLQYTVEIQLSL